MKKISVKTGLAILAKIIARDVYDRKTNKKRVKVYGRL